MAMVITNKDHTMVLLTNSVDEFEQIKFWCRSHFGKSHGDLFQSSWMIYPGRRWLHGCKYSIILKTKNSEMGALVALTFG